MKRTFENTVESSFELNLRRVDSEQSNDSGVYQSFPKRARNVCQNEENEGLNGTCIGLAVTHIIEDNVRYLTSIWNPNMSKKNSP